MIRRHYYLRMPTVMSQPFSMGTDYDTCQFRNVYLCATNLYDGYISVEPNCDDIHGVYIYTKVPV